MGTLMPVLENHSKYYAPARYDDEIRIVTFIKSRPSVRIKFEYDFYNNAGTLIHQGETLLAFVDKKTGKPCRPPEVFMRLLGKFF